MSPSFTVEYSKVSPILITETLISKPFIPQNVYIDVEAGKAKKFYAIWDTGATKSAITQKVVDECDLKPIGMCKVQTAGGERLCNNYLVSIFLQSKVVFPSVRVTEAPIKQADVLIGMDIINAGDFAITNRDQKTVFSFKVPSSERIDFVRNKSASIPVSLSAPLPAPVISPAVSRNAKCSCGSGKRYRKCCGKKVMP